MDSAKFSLNQEDRLLSQLLKVPVKLKRPKGIPLKKWSLSFTYLANTVPDPNLEIRRRGGGSSRPLDKRGTRSFGPQFVPKIRGGGGRTPWAPPPDPPLKCYFYGLFRGLRSETPNIQDIFGLFMTSQGKGTREGLLKPTKNLGFQNSKNLAQKLSRVLL